MRPAPRPPRARFVVAAAVPRRGWADAVVWPDTGVLLSLGVAPDLPARFRQQYRGRVRVARNVGLEVRGQSQAKAPDGDVAHRRREAAAVAVRELLLAGTSLPVVHLAEEDLPEVQRVADRLAALSDDPSKRHGGEAACIVLARRAAATVPGRHVLLTNDGGASTVADRYGIPSRHAADVLAELSCADPALTAAACWRHHQDAVAFSGIPANARPAGRSAFDCLADGGGTCRACDEADRAAGVSPRTGPAAPSPAVPAAPRSGPGPRPGARPRPGR